ncbi:GntR family transcriptional regulator [Alsobacter sp. SYSU M60028]|uniref:GntR family transcriptional regulator n=1 Tax=Alsobacter ponti TaxID=2962936 RepID=A0ABT1LGZ7_9HYPH|nr:GntR family transcriptional regulator [Alsobacter ponti]MCP8940777.1 GntR family transcriptional regulator [Alsobacter ponti]
MSQLSEGAVKDIVHRIGSRIVSGELKESSILPREAELASEYGVGRSTLREAVKVLSGKGLIRTVRRFGTQVCSSDEWNFLDPDVLGWYAAVPANVPALIFSIIELRSAIEPAAAALAARRASPREAADILRHAEALLAVLPSAPFEFDVAFHLGILNATHNVLFRGLGASYEVLLRAQFEAAWPRLWGEARYHPDDKHVALARAIMARDAAGASRVARDMMRTMRHNTGVMAEKMGVPAHPDRPGPRASTLFAGGAGAKPTPATGRRP